MRTWQRRLRRPETPAGSPNEGDAQKLRTKVVRRTPHFCTQSGQDLSRACHRELPLAATFCLLDASTHAGKQQAGVPCLSV